jgi:serine/threonine-protein kinase
VADFKIVPPAPEEDPQVTRARSRVGQVLHDKWRIDALLGVGGMAAVYAATHRNNKRVAVKMLHPELCGDTEVRQRFLSEGYAANIIEHDGAVSVLDDDVAPDGSAFLVMELLDGENLEQRWERKGGKLELRDVLIIADRLLDVLSAAHAKSIVHRDIKPENLFLTRQGQLKVLDFGIARVFEAQHKKSTTRAGMVMGTPAFMAPEQARARWDEVDGRTDLWAVGATMFTLLTGRHVHEADTGNEQLIKSATTPAPSIATIMQGLPRSVVATIDRALAFEREKRWADAVSMREAIRGSLDALAGGPSASRSGPQPSIPGSVEVPQGVQGNAATVISLKPDTRTQLESWAQERDTRAAEIAKLEPAVKEAQQRLADAKRRVADVLGRVNAARQERLSLEEWFKRQSGTRTAAVEEARREVRQHLMDVARRAVADRATFGDELNADREEIARLARASEARARDVEIHTRAISAHDKKAVRTGLLVGVLGVVVTLMLVIVPIVIKATWKPDLPPLPHEAPPETTS